MSELASRVFGLVARATIRKVDDAKRRQTVDLDLLYDERKTGVETLGAYGFKSVPIASATGEAAAAIVVFPNGDPTHGFVIATDDRRHRPRDWAAGESGLYDDQGQLVHLTRDGIRIRAGAAKKPIEASCGNATARIEDGKITLLVDGMKVIVTPTRIDLGGDGGFPVLTLAGPSRKVFAVL